MNPITRALEEGYDENEIVNFLANSFPNLKNKISKAINTGYSAKEIIRLLSNLGGQSSRTQTAGLTQQSVHAVKEKEDQLKEQQLLKGGLSLAGGALAGRALQNVIPKLSPLLSKRGLPKAPGPAPTAAPAPSGSLTATVPAQPAIAPSLAAVASQEVAKPSSEALLQQMGLDKRIKTLLSAKNPPDVVRSAIKSMVTPAQKTWLKNQTDQPIEEIVDEYISQVPEQETKSKMAVLPDGRVGSITEEKQGIASVELPNGQIARRKVSELDVESPELEEVIGDLVNMIPEKDRSSVLGFAQYNEPSKMMAVQFHSGDFYVYPEATKEQFEKIISNATHAKTSGENAYGLWSKGEESRGAGLHQVIKELEKDFGKNFIKFSVKGGYEYPLTTLIREIQKRIEKKRKQKPR